MDDRIVLIALAVEDALEAVDAVAQSKAGEAALGLERAVLSNLAAIGIGPWRKMKLTLHNDGMTDEFIAWFRGCSTMGYEELCCGFLTILTEILEGSPA